MCQECLQFPCHPRCPNAPEPPVMDVCDNCGREIRSGDTMWKFDIGTVCEECVDNHKTEAECEEDYSI